MVVPEPDPDRRPRRHEQRPGGGQKRLLGDTSCAVRRTHRRERCRRQHQGASRGSEPGDRHPVGHLHRIRARRRDSATPLQLATGGGRPVLDRASMRSWIGGDGRAAEHRQSFIARSTTAQDIASVLTHAEKLALDVPKGGCAFMPCQGPRREQSVLGSWYRRGDRGPERAGVQFDGEQLAKNLLSPVPLEGVTAQGSDQWQDDGAPD